MNAAVKSINRAEEVEAHSQSFETRSAEEILAWAAQHYAPRIVMTSSFGPEGIVLIDKIAKIAPETPILYLDTGYHFAETEELKEKVRNRYGVNIVEARASLSVEQQDATYGERLYERDSKLCCKLRKVEPLAEGLRGYDAWIVALRRDQSPTRAGIGKIEWNAKHELVKLNPIADWTRKDVWDYIVKNDLPYNPLHDEGYSSIGCQPCTQPVTIGSHERSGRWQGQGRLECGIHL